MVGLRSNPVLIDFWDYTCVNCPRTIPYSRYSAKEVNLVAYPPPIGAGSIEVAQDGHPLTEEESGADISFDEGHSFVLIDEPRMYALVNNDAFGTHELTIATASDEIGLFAFTFLTCVSEPIG